MTFKLTWDIMGEICAQFRRGRLRKKRHAPVFAALTVFCISKDFKNRLTRWRENRNYSADALPCCFGHVILAENMQATAKQKAGNQSKKIEKMKERMKDQ